MCRGNHSNLHSLSRCGVHNLLWHGFYTGIRNNIRWPSSGPLGPMITQEYVRPHPVTLCVVEELKVSSMELLSWLGVDEVWQWFATKWKPQIQTQKKSNHMKWCSLLILLHTYYISLHLTTSFYICLHLITSYHILWHIMIHCYILWHIITYYYILSFRISISTFNLYKMHCPVIVFFLYFEFASIICWGCSLNKSSLSNGGTVIPSVHSCSFHSFPV